MLRDVCSTHTFLHQHTLSFLSHCSILKLRPILSDLWKLIREPLKEGLIKGSCRDWNALAQGFQAANYETVTHFPNCDRPCSEVQNAYNPEFPTTLPTGNASCMVRRELKLAGGEHRQLPASGFNYTAGTEAIYGKYMVDLEDAMQFLAVFHDWDEALLTAWTDSGIEQGLEILYDIVDVVRIQ
jgi:hypothetical protein